jgi:Protein of unknown function (DUF5132)
MPSKGDRVVPKGQQAQQTAGQPSPQPRELPSAADTNGGLGSKLATIAAIGVGVALIEAELIPGMLIGVAAALAPNLLDKVGLSLRPLVKSAVRASLNLTEQAKEKIAEAGEQFQDIVAEVRAEQHTPANPHEPSTEPKHA